MPIVAADRVPGATAIIGIPAPHALPVVAADIVPVTYKSWAIIGIPAPHALPLVIADIIWPIAMLVLLTGATFNKDRRDGWQILMKKCQGQGRQHQFELVSKISKE